MTTTFSPVTVCFFIPAFADGGAQRQCIAILNELSRRDDVKVVLVRTARGVHDHLLDESRIDVRWVEVRSNYDPRIIHRVRRVLRETNADVLFSWLQAADIPSYFIRAITPRLAWVLAERNSFYRDELRFRVRAQLGRRANAVVSNSPAGDQYWAALRPRGRRYVIKNIVQLPQPLASVGEPQERYDVVCVGRLERQKNTLVTLDAFAEVARQMPGTSFAFIGEGSVRPELERRISDYGLAHQIKILGFRSDAAALIAHARLLVTLSHYEGMPNVLAEAIVFGTPVVVSHIPQHIDVIGEGYSHAVREYDDAASAATAIRDALENGTSSVDAVRAELLSLTPEHVVDEYVRMFKETAGAPRREVGQAESAGP